MEISLCTLISGYLVAFSGLNVKLHVQPTHVLHKLFWMAIIPTIIFAIVSLLLSLKFRMTEASMDEVRIQLEIKRKAHPESAPDDEISDPDVEAWAGARAQTGPTAVPIL